jgi:hypothetical protein
MSGYGPFKSPILRSLSSSYVRALQLRRAAAFRFSGPLRGHGRNLAAHLPHPLPAPPRGPQHQTPDQLPPATAASAARRRQYRADGMTGRQDGAGSPGWPPAAPTRTPTGSDSVFTVRHTGTPATLRASLNAQHHRSRAENPQVSDPRNRSRPERGQAIENRSPVIALIPRPSHAFSTGSLSGCSGPASLLT